jgi:oxalate decarboxylase/phosphoglucose isomerase-like protein (cupin superfamily)
MIDLNDVSGLPIQFDPDTSTFVLSEELGCDGEYKVKLSEIVPVLLNKYLKYPEVVYTHRKNIAIKGIESEGVSYDLLHIPFGLLGIEYMKTHVYYSDEIPGKYDCVVEVLQGELTAILQKNEAKEDEWQYDTNVEDLSILVLRKGHKLAIPTGYFYTFVNTGSLPLIISKVSAIQKHSLVNYDVLKREKGLACYIISKNAKIETVANPKYKVPAKLKATGIGTFMEKKSQDESQKEIFKNKDPLAKMISAVKSFVL